VAAALEAVGYEAGGRSGYLTASAAFERAAALSPEPDARARRLYRAALTYALVAEGNRKLPLLERALAATRDDDLRFAIQLTHGGLTFLFDPVAGARLLLCDAALLEQDHPDRALVMVATVAAGQLRIHGAPDAVGTARRAAELAERAHDADPFIPFVNAAALLVDGRLHEALPLLETSVQPLSEEVELAFGGGEARRASEFIVSANLLAQVLLATGDVERAARCLVVGLAWAASRGAAQAPWRMFAARLDYLAGRWAEATAGLDEAVRLARESGYPYLVWQAATGRSELAAAQGAEAELAAFEAAAAEAEALWAPMASLGWLGGCGQGLLALGHGRAEEAASIYRRTLPLDAPLKLYPQTADAIEAFLRAGQTADATSLLAEFTTQAEQTRWPWALARSAHLQALAGPADGAFQRALELDELAAQPFPHARTQLAYGEWLRRDGRRIDARTQLRAALEAFEQLGAEPWAEQARAELRATGERLRQRTGAPLGELTPQELQVALVVARGATNKEAAAQLYLSPKTIEKHLGSTYMKLGLRSRTELAAAFAAAG
jgi:DNA-binding CsgD family transcriptional regulator